MRWLRLQKIFFLLLALSQFLAQANVMPLSWEEAYNRAEKLVGQMSIEQMANITTGQGWGQKCVGQTHAIQNPSFPSLCLMDGPLGLRPGKGNTVNVAGINAAASFDKKAIYTRGYYMGQEFRDQGANVQLGPVLNIQRTPEAGRGWEAGGEDPFFSGVVAAETIKGIQDAGVIASAKHYILNDQESNRFTASIGIDDRTLHEVYLWPFARAVEAGVGSIMCSYNLVNGTHVCENDYVLNKILKGELQFKGFVLSDWGATPSTTKAANAGLDMDMPGTIGYDVRETTSYFGKNLTLAVQQKRIEKERLVDMATRIVATWYKMRQDINYPKLMVGTNERVNVPAEHANLVRSMGSASCVLLKNLGILPVSPRSVNKIAIIGSDAGPNPLYRGSPMDCLQDTCINGTVAQGGGSGSAEFPYIIEPLSGLSSIFGSYAKVAVSLDDNNLVKAAEAAKDATIAFLFANTFASEGYDRVDLKLRNNADALIEAVAAANENTVVIVHSVGPAHLPWANHPNIKAILWPGLPGQETGRSLADVITGFVNPSGRLPYTIARKLENYNTKSVASDTIRYSEKLLVVYRWFDQSKTEPLYPFGHGLSYTSFGYSDIKVERMHTTDANNSVIIKATIKNQNTGIYDGAEIVQAYISFPQDANKPPKLLRGFEKVFLKKSESSFVSFEYKTTELSIWDTSQSEWIVPSGTYVLHVGASSRDIRQSATFNL